MKNIISQIAVVLFVTLFMVGNVSAEQDNSTKQENSAKQDDSAEQGSSHKLVIQVSTDDPRTQKIALNNAVNLQKLYGMDNVKIEVVAYGPGLGLLTKKSGQASRVESLATQDITFSACQNTMNKVKKKTGKLPVLSEGVQTVNAGVARIMELQEQGYAYIRP